MRKFTTNLKRKGYRGSYAYYRSLILLKVTLFIACAGGVLRYLLSVLLCVTTIVAASFISTIKQRYEQLQISIVNSWIF